MPKSAFKKRKLPFTSREKDILRLLITGLTNRQIADKLGIAYNTVCAYVLALLFISKQPNRIKLTLWAQANTRLWTATDRLPPKPKRVIHARSKKEKNLSNQSRKKAG